MSDLLHKDDPARIYEIKEVLLTHFLADKTISKLLLDDYRINLMSQGIYASMIKRVPLSYFNLKDQDTIEKIKKFEKKLENLVKSSNEIHDFIFTHSNSLEGNLSFRFNEVAAELKENINNYKAKTENELTTKGKTDLDALKLVDAFMAQYLSIEGLPPTKVPKEISEGGIIEKVLKDLFKKYKLIKSEDPSSSVSTRVISVYRRWYKLKGYKY